MKIALITTVLALSGCGVTVQQESGPRTITYAVSGTAYSAEITYGNETSGMAIVQSTSDLQGHMAWEKTITLPSGVSAYLHAQNNGTDGTVAVEISGPGGAHKRVESSGAYCIASAAL